ncbi:MAG: T9SS type A sorting domain-containing protein [Bacteroidota bacterium]
MAQFFTSLVTILLFTFTLSAQNITVTAAIGLADDFCTFPVNDPDTDCINVPVANNSLTYLPGEDGQILITYRITNNSPGTITSVLLTDSDRGTILPVSTVNIPPGAVRTTTRIFAAETLPRDVTPTVTATLESSTGMSTTVTDTYDFEVVAPSVTTSIELYRAEEECTDPEDLVTCGPSTSGNATLSIVPGDNMYFELNVTNSGLSTLTSHNVTITELGVSISSSGLITPITTFTFRAIPTVPTMPGTYNYTANYTSEDLAGNPVSSNIPITLIIPEPEAAVEIQLYVARDFCPDPEDLASCPVGSSGTNTLTIPPGRNVYVEFDITNTGFDTLTNHEATIPSWGDVTSTSLRLQPGGTIIVRNFIAAPTLPGTYNYTGVYTAEDLAGNEFSISLPITLEVPTPEASVEVQLYVARDFCPDPEDLASCPVGSSGTNTLTIPPGRNVYVEFDITNTGLDTLTNHVATIPGWDDVTSTSLRLRQGGTIIVRNFIAAPTLPGTYNYTGVYTAEDDFGNEVSINLPITLVVPAPVASVEVELYVARDFCPDPEDLASCPVGSSGTNTLTIPPGRNVYVEFDITNTGLDTLTNHVATIPGWDDVTSTSLRLRQGGTIIVRNLIAAPTLPGTYNYTGVYTAEDDFGNEFSINLPITLEVPAPEASLAVELYLAEDLCTDPNSLATCSVGSSGTTTLTLAPGSNAYIEFEVTNTGIDTLTNHNATIMGWGDITSTSARIGPVPILILRNLLAAPTLPGTYNFTAVYTAEDDFGNEVSISLPVTVIVDCSLGDNVPPIANCQDISLTVMDGITSTITAGQINDGSFDQCGSVSGALDITEFTCADVGDNTVTLTITDEEGNSSDCQATVTVEADENIALGPVGECVSVNTPLGPLSVNNFINITGPEGRLIAAVRKGSNPQITSVQIELYREASETAGTGDELRVSKRLTITPLNMSGNPVNPLAPVDVRIYYREAELLALEGESGLDRSNFQLVKDNASCGAGGFTGLNAGVLNTTKGVLGCANASDYYETTVLSFSTFYLFADATILPVDWSSFTATAKGQDVLLNWATTAEENNSHFEVERSTDGRQFQFLAKVESSGSSFGDEYSFLDDQPISGTNYYRIKQVDFDGSSSFSEIRQVRMESSVNVKVFPNPAHDFLYLEGLDGEQVEITNGQGKTVLQYTYQVASPIPVAQLPAGLYFLRTSAGVLRWVKS